MKKEFSFLLLIILFLIPVLLPFLRPGFFITDDGEWMIIRLSDFHRSLADGQIPPRWAGRLNHGYGYPVFNFLYPGTLYFGETFHLLGFGFLNSVKALFLATFVFSAFFTFLWIRKIFKKDLEALVGALFFTFLPYHLFDVFKRGSLGEAAALTFVPLFFYASEKNLFWLKSLSFGFMILCHNSIAFLFLPVLFFHSWTKNKDKKIDLPRIFFPFLVGLGLSCFFWLPALFELSYTQFGKTTISQPAHFFLNSQTFYLIGFAGVLVLFFNLFLCFKKREKKTTFFSILYLLAVFFSLSFSKPFWKLSWLRNLVQFPFRFLSLTLPAGAYLSANLISHFKGLKRLCLWLFLVIILVVFSWPHLIPKEYINKEEGFYTTNESTTTVADEYLPVWVKEKPKERFKEKVKVIKGRAEIKNLFFNSKKTLFDISAAGKAVVQINTIYYPGWQIFVDGEKTKIDYDNKAGLITFRAPPGESKVLARFDETYLRLFSDIISLVSFGLIIFLIINKFVVDKFRSLRVF